MIEGDISWSDWLADDLAVDDPNPPNPQAPHHSTLPTKPASLSPTLSTSSGGDPGGLNTIVSTSGSISPLQILPKSPGLPAVNTALDFLLEGREHLCDPKRYYSFWRRVLTQHFPPDQGFVVQEPIQNKHLTHPFDVTVFEEGSKHPTAVMVVAHASTHNPHISHGTGTCTTDGQPLVILHLRTPMDYYNDYSREDMREKIFVYFDKFMRTSHFSNTMVITAMGQAFRAWRKSTIFTEEQENEWSYISDRTSGQFAPSAGPVPEDIRDTGWNDDVLSREGQALLLTMCRLVQNECCLQCWNDCGQIY